MKLSGPNLNIVFIAGIILMYILVILLGIEDELLEGRGVNALCQFRIWIGTIAFTLAYGSVVAKSFRVYYIFKNLKVQKKDKKTKLSTFHAKQCRPNRILTKHSSNI